MELAGCGYCGSCRQLASYAYRAGEDAQAGEIGDGGLAWAELSLALSPSRETAQFLVELYQETGHSEAVAGVWQGVATALPEDQPIAGGAGAGSGERGRLDAGSVGLPARS